MGTTTLTLFPPPPPWIMGIVNVTPDSFSDGGRFLAAEAAIAAARQMLADGAHLIDIGGESTAPGRRPITAEEELVRIEPVVAALAPEAFVSIDTYHAATAARCLASGARMINDTSALRAEPALADVVREHGAFLVLMHAKDGPLPHVTPSERRYADVVREVGDFLAARVDFALSRGIPAERLILDPGWSAFLSHDPEDTFRLLRDFERLVARFRPIPLMVAISRKGVLKVPLAERDPISQLAALVAVARGALYVRTHAPKMMVQFLETARRCAWPLPDAPASAHP
ncbi:MAG: dihydropteroate synthase [Geminicoccaceae bacterium]|nr:dihydropteroate synthase [Geminicoccaceae bacterium]